MVEEEAMDLASSVVLEVSSHCASLAVQMVGLMQDVEVVDLLVGSLELIDVWLLVREVEV